MPILRGFKVAVVVPESSPEKKMVESITCARFTEDGRLSGTFEVFPSLYQVARTFEFLERNGFTVQVLKDHVLNIPEGKSLEDLRIEDVQDQFRDDVIFTAKEDELSLRAIAQQLSTTGEAS